MTNIYKWKWENWRPNLCSKINETSYINIVIWLPVKQLFIQVTMCKTYTIVGHILPSTRALTHTFCTEQQAIKGPKMTGVNNLNKKTNGQIYIKKKNDTNLWTTLTIVNHSTLGSWFRTGTKSTTVDLNDLTYIWLTLIKIFLRQSSLCISKQTL